VTFSSSNEPVAIPRAASETVTELRRLVEDGRSRLIGSDGREIELPVAVQQLLLTILKNLQAGRAVSIGADHQELATDRAAEILGVSRPFLLRLLEQGHIPFHTVESHRRVNLDDLLAYKRQRDRARHDAVDRLAQDALADGIYDTVFLPNSAEEE